MNNSQSLFANFEQLGSKTLNLMKNHSFSSPGSKQSTLNKFLRTWSLTEASSLIGRTTQCIRDHENKVNGLPKPKTTKNNKRYYTLEDINNIRKYFGTKPFKPPSSIPAIIAFTNFKGGVAKTTSAVHAAHYFSRAGYRVLLTDLDSQASTTSSFGYAPDEDIKNNETLKPFLLGKLEHIKEIITHTYWPNLDLIPANLSLYGIELELPVLRENALKSGQDLSIFSLLHNGFTQIYENYDIIIIDCPPAMSILNTNALCAANALIVPCPPAIPDIASMFQFFGMISDALKKLQNKEFNFIRILITRHDGGKTSYEIATVLRKLFGAYVMRNEMSTTQAIIQCRAELNSIYETTTYKGSKQTLLRAQQIFDSINRELEEYILESWGLMEETIHKAKQTEVNYA